jgi:DNA-cytosine methyltransferase
VRHASFFSGVGGLDLGFERAGIKTVSVCEIDPYASSVLAERFPDAPNLGSITEVQAHDIPEADIWSGGFPCQDLSVAGKRAGFAGKRSSLAFTFLDLVEQRRPRWLLLENVPGLFTSNKGADFARLLYEMEQLGYSVAWRTLDARYFGVAQRRRRVFIVASLESDRASQVLFECQGCERHPAPRKSSWQGVASGTSDGSRVNHHGAVADQPSAPLNTDGMRAVDGLARGVDNQQIMEKSLTGGGSDSPQSERIWSEIGTSPTLDTGRAVPQVFRKSARVTSSETPETWVDDGLANTLNNFDVGDIRTTHIVLGGEEIDDEFLPLGLDSNRYRCCGNGVVANVAEWIGHRIIAADQEFQHDRMLAAMDDFSDRAEGLEIPYRDD